MPQRNSHGNAVYSWQESGEYVVGSKRSSGVIRFDSIEEMRDLADALDCYHEADGDEIESITVNGHEVTRLRDGGHAPDSPSAFDIPDSTFTIGTDQIRAAADALSVPDEPRLRFVSSSGDYGAELPHDADYTLVPHDRGRSHPVTILFNQEDNLDDGLGSWSPDSRSLDGHGYDSGAHVTGDVEVVVE